MDSAKTNASFMSTGKKIKVTNRMSMRVVAYCEEDISPEQVADSPPNSLSISNTQGVVDQTFDEEDQRNTMAEYKGTRTDSRGDEISAIPWQSIKGRGRIREE